MPELQKGVDEGAAILLTPHAGQKVVFKFKGQGLTQESAREVRDMIQAQWGTEVPFVVVDDSIDVYVASDEELLRTPELEQQEDDAGPPGSGGYLETGSDQEPHSRACGYRAHPHGLECHSNCPTCGGTVRLRVPRGEQPDMSEPLYDLDKKEWDKTCPCIRAEQLDPECEWHGKEEFRMPELEQQER